MIQKAIGEYLRKNNQKQITPKAFLFDMDGVLYNSMPYHARAWKEIADKHGLSATEEDFYLFEGRTGEETINVLFQRTFGRDATSWEKESIYNEKADLFNTYNDGKVMEGVLHVLERIKAHGLQTLVVTGSGQHSLFEKLDQDFKGFFNRSQMVTAYDVKNGKPDPEPYLMGLEKAGVKSDEAIVVENAPMGVESAVAAGIFTIAVNTGPLPDSVLLNAGANLLYPDMNKLANDIDLIIG